MVRALAIAAGFASVASAQVSWTLDSIKSGSVPKADLEIVLANHDENLAWSDMYAPVRTVYCKDKICPEGSIQVPNVGREGHTFLHHIVNNYDKLAKWTVFAQAGEPNEAGSGASFADYVLHPTRKANPQTFFMITAKVHLNSLSHSIRASPYQSEPPMHREMCPSGSDGDAWYPYQDMDWFRHYLSNKCAVELEAVSSELLKFWENNLDLPVPDRSIIHYTHQTRFAASSDRIRQRPLAFYKKLLEHVSTQAEPCANDYYKWFWFYIIGKPTITPCGLTSDELADKFVTPERMLSIERMLADNSSNETTTVGLIDSGAFEPKAASWFALLGAAALLQAFL